jgi:hypothetical protein
VLLHTKDPKETSNVEFGATTKTNATQNLPVGEGHIMKKIFTFWLVLAALASHITALVHADAVLDWNQHAATAIISPAPTGAGKPAAIGLVDLAIVRTAIYDALNAIAGYPFDPYEVTPTVTIPASPEAAAATAGHDTLVALFPAQQTDLDAKYATSLAQIPDGPAKTNGIAVGQ